MTLERLENSGMIIFEGVVGSQAYGISTPTSDIDTKGVFIQPIEDILGFGYVEQVSDAKNDRTFFEVRRFLQLLQTANPTMLELLHLPEDCVRYKHSIMEKILAHKDLFVTQVCRNSFGGYAIDQIKKARGLNKKIVQVGDKIPVRKTVLDFCFAIVDSKSMPLQDYLDHKGYTQDKCGLAKIPHGHDLYSLYYSDQYTYRGITEEGSNEVRLTSIPRWEQPEITINFNKDAYSRHCKEFNEEQKWIANRNPHRFADNMLHGKGYDGKNLAHCHRLLDMAIEIGEGRGVNVRRPNREQLLSIRRGEYDYDHLISEAEDKIKRIDEIYKDSTLPPNLDRGFVDVLLIQIRKEFYGLNN